MEDCNKHMGHASKIYKGRRHAAQPEVNLCSALNLCFEEMQCGKSFLESDK